MPENTRCFERYPVRRPIYAFLSGDMEDVGLLKDISMGGLSVEYLVLGELAELPPHRGRSGTVFITVGPEMTEPMELPYRFVHSQNISQTPLPWGVCRYYVERCGIAFEELTQLQRDELSKLVTTFQ